MSEINLDIFLEELVSKKILEHVTKYCSKCYYEISENEKIYYDTQACNYLCFKCAYEKTQEMQEQIELIEEEEQTTGLF